MSRRVYQAQNLRVTAPKAAARAITPRSVGFARSLGEPFAKTFSGSTLDGFI